MLVRFFVAVGLAVPALAVVGVRESPVAQAACVVSTIESQGRSNDAVRCIQRALRSEGFGPGPIDGVFGSQTAAAVAAYQTNRGISNSAVVTPRTARALGIWKNPPCAPAKNVPASATTVVDVRSSGSWATLRLMKRTATGWKCKGAVMPARVGRNGVRPLARRVGGDGTAPSGVFRLGKMTAPNGDVFRFFGTKADPGVQGAWHDVQPNDCWWTDPGTKKYNRLIRRSASRCTGENEYLPSYRKSYSRAALIAANMGRNRVGDDPGETPRAAAIFLHRHAKDGRGRSKATSGCVSLSGRKLDFVLRRLPTTGTYFSIS